MEETILHPENKQSFVEEGENFNSKISFGQTKLGKKMPSINT